jgi:hypothetical protein
VIRRHHGAARLAGVKLLRYGSFGAERPAVLLADWRAVDVGDLVGDFDQEWPSSVVGPNDGVLLPPGSTHTDWEVELAVVVGAPARYLADEKAAHACIAGYAISNDVSERHYQKDRGGQWVKGKSAESFNPLGPWLVTPDEAGDVGNLALSLDVNGERMQDGLGMLRQHVRRAQR